MLTALLLLLAQTPSPVPDATPSRRGVVNRTTQSFSGQKTFTDGGIVTHGLTVDGGARVSGDLAVDGGVVIGGALAVDAGITQFGGQPVQSATSAAIALFVDPAGSNSNTCLASGAANACLTIAGAVAKLPRFLQHSSTITVASGAYTTGFVSSALPTPVVIGQGIGLTIQGAMENSTVATGTATGTCTAAAAGSSSGPATCTDSGQSWTVDNLKGKFITFSSGTLSGQSFPIVTNSATVITFPSTTSSGTVAYTIQEPGAVFTTSGANLPLNFSGNGNITLSKMKFVVTAGNGFTFASTALTGINVTWQDLSISASSTALSVFSGLHAMRRCYVTSSGSHGISVIHTNPTWSPTLSVTTSYIRVTTAAFHGVTIESQSEMAVAPVTSSSIEVATGIGVNLKYGQFGQNASGWITCTTTGSGTGIVVGTVVSATAPGTLSSHTFNGTSVRITGCGTGLSVASAPASAVVGAITLDTVTTGFSVTKGGIIDFFGATPTFTSVTNELSYDGTFSTFAALVAAGPPALLTNAYGSRIIR
jgi:hypothetical protein